MTSTCFIVRLDLVIQAAIIEISRSLRLVRRPSIMPSMGYFLPYPWPSPMDLPLGLPDIRATLDMSLKMKVPSSIS